MNEAEDKERSAIINDIIQTFNTRRVLSSDILQRLSQRSDSAYILADLLTRNFDFKFAFSIHPYVFNPKYFSVICEAIKKSKIIKTINFTFQHTIIDSTEKAKAFSEALCENTSIEAIEIQIDQFTSEILQGISKNKTITELTFIINTLQGENFNYIEDEKGFISRMENLKKIADFFKTHQSLNITKLSLVRHYNAKFFPSHQQWQAFFKSLKNHGSITELFMNLNNGAHLRLTKEMNEIFSEFVANNGRLEKLNLSALGFNSPLLFCSKEMGESLNKNKVLKEVHFACTNENLGDLLSGLNNNRSLVNLTFTIKGSQVRYSQCEHFINGLLNTNLKTLKMHIYPGATLYDNEIYIELAFLIFMILKKSKTLTELNYVSFGDAPSMKATKLLCRALKLHSSLKNLSIPKVPDDLPVLKALSKNESLEILTWDFREENIKRFEEVCYKNVSLCQLISKYGSEINLTLTERNKKLRKKAFEFLFDEIRKYWANLLNFPERSIPCNLMLDYLGEDLAWKPVSKKLLVQYEKQILCEIADPLSKTASHRP